MADGLLSRAKEEWQSNNLDEARNDALLGQIKLKHALALAEQDKARKRIAAAEAETQTAEDEDGRLQKELASLNEQVALLKRLQDATAEQQKLSQELSAEQQKANQERVKAGAVDRISDAELAIKTAETVNAGTHAKVPFAAATDNLTRAKTELQQGNYQAAQTSAEMAKIKAGEAVAAAKPLYDQEAAAEENKVRAEARPVTRPRCRTW